MGNSICSACNKDANKDDLAIYSSNLNKPYSTNTKAKSGLKPSDLIQTKHNIYSFMMFLKLQRSVRRMIRFRNQTRYNREDYKENATGGAEGAGGAESGQGNGTEVKEMMKRSGFNDKNCVYKGEYEGKYKQGFGIQTWKDGAIYKGYFFEGKANYLGIFLHSDGDVYRGEFKDDRACGFGSYKHANGANYEGNWVEDNQSGIGVELWTDKSDYQGEYLKGKKHGYGFYNWADGSYYQGEWFDNTLHGYVSVFLKNFLRVFIALWIKGFMQENGI